MNTSADIDPKEFVSLVQPVLECQDLQGLHTLLKSRWNAAQIVSLLTCKCCDARKVAALCLSLVGRCCCIPELAKQLADRDPMVNQMAEHAMWAIWFRAGSPESNHQLARGVKAIARRDYPHAIKHFDRAVDLTPNFAEAFNQRAIAKFLMEQFDDSLNDCRKVIELEPHHFGAWAGSGHNHAHAHRAPEAIDCYSRALVINPHMHAIRAALCELQHSKD